MKEEINHNYNEIIKNLTNKKKGVDLNFILNTNKDFSN